MNSEVVRISQIKLIYNETKKCIVAKIVTVFENGLKQEKTISKMDLISDMLSSFAKQEDLTIPELIEKGLVIVDANLKDKEVLIKDDDGNYHKLVYDFAENMFNEKRLTRIERRELGLISVNDDNVEDNEVNNEISEEMPAESFEEKPLTSLMNFTEIFEAIRKLNPTVEFRLGDKETDPRYDTRIFASVEGSELILPEGFYYNEKNGITNKHHTINGNYVTIDVEPIVKSEENSLNNDTSEQSLTESDGALDVSDAHTVSESREVIHEEENKGKKSIKLLKYAARALAIVAAGYVIVKSGIFSFKNNNNDKNSNDNSNDNNYEDSIETSHIETTYNTPEPETVNEVLVENNGVYENNDEDMEVLIQQVNDICFAYDPFSLYTLVSDSDRQPLEVISTYRNETLANQYDVVTLLDQYVKYIFEGGTMFNGNVVKAYDYLSPFARYVVLVSAQSMLQLYPDYNYSTIYNGSTSIYDYDSVTDSFNDYIDVIYRELTNKNKTY